MQSAGMLRAYEGQSMLSRRFPIFRLSPPAESAPAATQDRPKIAQDRPKTAPGRPKIAQDRPKTAPRWPKRPP